MSWDRKLKTVKAVVFDMDGLMLDTERLFRRAYQQAAMENGYDLSDELYARMIGHRADSSHRILREGLGESAPCDDIIEGARRHYYQLIERGGIPLRPGLIELLDYLDQESLPRAVATSTHYELACIKLKAVGLLPRFFGVVSGDQVKHGKPAPDIYLEAARLLSVEPGETLALEDSAAGLTSAHRAGMITFLIPDLMVPDEKTTRMANAVFSGLLEVKSCLQEARAK